MKIIGHRGAGQLAFENSYSAIKAARSMQLDGIEIDVRVTKDLQLVVCHDKTLLRIAGKKIRIDSHSLADLQAIKLRDGSSLISLAEAIEAAGDMPMVIEGKSAGWADPLNVALKNYPYKKSLSVISFNHDELFNFKKLCPDIDVYPTAIIKVRRCIKDALKFKFDGIDVYFISLFLFGLGIRKHPNMKIIVYGINSRFVAKLFNRIFPDAGITTDYPHHLKQLVKKVSA